MKFARFSIASLLSTVAIFAVGLACLMFASTPWAGAVLSVTLGILTLALLGVGYRRGERRAFWVGFALCGWAYMALSSGPWFTDYIRPRLVTTSLLDWLYPLLIPSARQPNARNAKLASTITPVEFEGDLTFDDLGKSPVDVWVRGEDKGSPTLLAEGVVFGGGSNGRPAQVHIVADAAQFAKPELAKARLGSRTFILRPHPSGLFDPLWASPPVSPKQFENVGHSLFGLLCAWLGSVAARYLFATRDHAAATEAGDT
jgi:hypothetical protein